MLKALKKIQTIDSIIGMWEDNGDDKFILRLYGLQ